jgi:SOS-response transcriptional repressor LexA
MFLMDRCAEAVHGYIRDHWKAHGQAPTRAEIQQSTGYSAMQIDRRIVALEAGGYVTRRLGRKRTIEVTSKPLPPIEAR